MTLGESPAVARRRVRLALRGAREERGLTQGQVAKALDWSLSKVQRIESGEVSVSTTDLRALLAYFKIEDSDLVDQLMDDARTSRRQRWYTDSTYREHLTPGTLLLLQFESEATAIRSFALTLIPGLVQTPAYAKVALETATAVLSAEQRRVRYEVRMRRREQVLDRPDPPEYLLLLDESALWREIGGARVTAEQLEALLDLAGRPDVHIRVIPFAEAAAVALLGPFTVFDIGEERDAVLYREGYDQDEIIQADGHVQHHREIFEALWARSLDEPASERLIRARAASLLSSLDKHTFPS
jgi:transcriptional regulator with XRE-family HTH domain